MTAPVPPTDTWQPVDMRWRLVRAGDVVLDPNGAPWMVTSSELSSGGRMHVYAYRTHPSGASTVDPEQTVRVLVPWPEAAGIVMLREGLGPVRVLDRGEVA